MTQEITPVVFRAEKSGKFKGDVTAVFPTLPADYAGRAMSCYAHVGKHSGACFPWYYGTRAAKPDEYADLMKELESVGYRLKVYQKITRGLREEFNREVDRLNRQLKEES